MKIRLDFVTNSSSSSFVIAKRNDCTKKDIEKIFTEDMEKLTKYIRREFDYMELDNLPQDIEEKLAKNNFSELSKTMQNKLIKYIINEIVDQFYEIESDITIENWGVSAKECGTEGGSSFIESFLYSYLSNIDTDKIKISSSW